LPSLASQEEKEGRGTPKDALSNLRALRRGSALSGGRSPFGVPPRLLPKGLSIPRARFGPGFVRQGTKAAGLPASAKPHFQRCTSRAGLGAGGLMPEPPGNGLQFRPRAPLLLRWPGMPPDHVLHISKATYLGGVGIYSRGGGEIFLRLSGTCTLINRAEWPLRSESDRKLHRREMTRRATTGHPIDYSITSSAVICMICGTVRFSALAVLRLITNSNLVDCITGRSAGFSPFRIRLV
jgi:hypothetical protein